MDIRANQNFINTNSDMYVSHLKHEISFVEEYESSVYSVQDLCIKNIGTENLYIADDVFLLSMPRNINYLHLMTDVFGQYLVLKSIVPNLKICVVLEHEEHVLGSESIENFIDLFLGIGRKDYLLLNKYKTIKFKNIYFTETLQYGHFLKDVLNIPQTPTNDSENNPTKYHMAAAGFLNKSFENYTTMPSEIGKKIFFSRLSSNRSLRLLSNINKNEKYPNLNDEESISKISKKHSVDVYTRNVWARNISLGDEIFLEDFFKYILGYDIIDAAEYPIEEQIAISRNASHITGLGGAAFINTLFCNKDARIIILSLSDIKNYPFGILPKSVGLEYHMIPSVAEEEAENAIRLDADGLIDLVKQKEHLFM